MVRVCTRANLKYVWIEFSSTLDGRAFAKGIKTKCRWRSVVLNLPRKKIGGMFYHVDSAHPLLPIHWTGKEDLRTLMILPNDREEKSEKYVREPIFNAYRRNHTNDEFDEEIRKQNRFLSKWVFSPGVKKVSGRRQWKKGELTLKNDFTDYADLVVASGHGSNGAIWGGGRSIDLRWSSRLSRAHTDRLKYIIIATCHMLAEHNARTWLPAMRRKNPVRGVLGYRYVYRTALGKRVFKRFADKLQEKGGTKTILEAWKEAHTKDSEPARVSWAALLHVTAAKDTMKDWLTTIKKGQRKGKGLTPVDEEKGEIRWYCDENYPDGKVPKLPEYHYTAYFCMGRGEGATKITCDNNFRDESPDVGLFPGEKGQLEIAKNPSPREIKEKKTSFDIGGLITITFYFYREDHEPGMNLDRLLTFDKPGGGAVKLKDGAVKLKDGSLRLIRDFNRRDKDQYVDAIEFEFTTSVPKTQLHYTVRDDAHEYFKPVPACIPVRLFYEYKDIFELEDLYNDGAWLRGPRPKKASTP